MKKTAIILILCMALALLAGCSGEVKTQEYNLDCGASLTAMAGLEEVAQEPFTTTLQGNKVMIMLLDEHRQLLGGEDMTLEDYGALVTMGNSLSEDFSKNEQGIYTNRYTKDGYFYHLSIHESGSSFWLIQMACTEGDRETYEPLFDQWCATVVLKDTQIKTVETIEEKVFQIPGGMEITLPDDMAEASMEGYTAFFHNNMLGCVLLAEEKPEGWTLADYAQALSDGYGMDPLTENEYGVPSTAFTADGEGISYYYYVTIFETEKDFWLCQIYCIDSMVETYAPYMPAWGSSLKSVE